MPFSKGLDGLSPRERQVLELSATGLTDHAISSRLGISTGTLNTYWARVRVKLGEVSRVELATRLTAHKACMAMDALREQNAELLGTLNGLGKAESDRPLLDQRTKSLIFAMPVALLILDEDGKIIESNPASEELLGYDPGTLVGNHLRNLIPARYHGWHAEQRMAFQATPERRTMGSEGVTVAMTKTGKEIPVVTTMNLCAMPDGKRFICILRRVS